MHGSDTLKPKGIVMKIDVPAPLTHKQAIQLLVPLLPFILAEAKVKGNEARLYVSGKGHRGPVWIAPTQADGFGFDAESSVDLGFFDTRVCTFNSDGSLIIRGGEAATGGVVSRSTAQLLNSILKGAGQKLQSIGQGLWMVRPLDPTVGLAGNLSLFHGEVLIPAAK